MRNLRKRETNKKIFIPIKKKSKTENTRMRVSSNFATNPWRANSGYRKNFYHNPIYGSESLLQQQREETLSGNKDKDTLDYFNHQILKRESSTIFQFSSPYQNLSSNSFEFCSDFSSLRSSDLTSNKPQNNGSFPHGKDINFPERLPLLHSPSLNSPIDFNHNSPENVLVSQCVTEQPIDLSFGFPTPPDDTSVVSQYFPTETINKPFGQVNFESGANLLPMSNQSYLNVTEDPISKDDYQFQDMTHSQNPINTFICPETPTALPINDPINLWQMEERVAVLESLIVYLIPEFRSLRK
ncbi:hypothetical protein G9A89_010640 [Geosiphon pyriformis]|nr:hypothetical protein G9A89_010640 [Geosiphon pyriformis]